MKKSLIIAILLAASLILISCGGGNTGSPADKTPPASVTPKELLQKIPTTIEEFDAQSSARSARTVTTVIPTSIHDHGYTDMSGGDLSISELLITILKYDICNSSLLHFNDDIDISSLSITSEESASYFEEYSGSQLALDDVFDNLGTIRITYENGKMTLFWLASMGGEEGAIYISGQFSNGCYSEILCICDNWIEEYSRNGSACFFRSECLREDGATAKSVTIKDGEGFVWYQVGSYDLAENPVPVQLEAAAQCRWIRYKDSTGAASFKYGKNSPAFKVYEVYDTDGSLMFYERMNLLPTPESEYTQRIPLKYLSWGDKTLKVNDNNSVNHLDESSTIDDIYYFEDDSQNPITAITAFGIELDPDEDDNPVHGYYPFYTLKNESQSALYFGTETRFSMPRWNEVKTSIDYLDSLAAETYDPDFLAGFISHETISELKSQLTAWIASHD